MSKNIKKFISVKDLDFNFIEKIFYLASNFKKESLNFNFEKEIISLLFYENSTRTKKSFQIAAENLKCKIIDFEIKTSSIQKGENLKDTIQTLLNLGSRIFVIRHSISQIYKSLIKEFEEENIYIINAGDGSNEHPSQALLDLFTLYEDVGGFKELKNKNLVIIGDCLHSRVARSNIYLLKKFGINVSLVGPRALIPSCFEELDVKIFHNLKEGLSKADFIMVLRLQKERQEHSFLNNINEYIKNFGINEENLKANEINIKNIKILHPGPVNRDVELSSEYMDNKNISLINQQAKNGLFIRMALLYDFLNQL